MHAIAIIDCTYTTFCIASGNLGRGSSESRRGIPGGMYGGGLGGERGGSQDGGHDSSHYNAGRNSRGGGQGGGHGDSKNKRAPPGFQAKGEATGISGPTGGATAEVNG